VRLPGGGANGEWTDLDTALSRDVREALAPIADDAVPATADEIEAIAHRLREQRIAPLEEYLEGVSRLYVAGVGAMAGVPVELLTEDRFTVSYTPSGTQLARLSREERPPGPATLLALGDAVFDLPGDEEPAPMALPPGGLLITQVIPEGNAAGAGLRDGDVLVAYAGDELASVEQLGQLIAAHAQDESVTVTVWRETEDQTATRQVGPGRLDVALAREPAREAITARREADLFLAASRGGDWEDLPGTRVEVSCLAARFDSAGVTLLLDSVASEERLEALRVSGELEQFHYLHLATHGEANRFKAFESALILAQDKLPMADEVAAGAPFFDGRLTAGDVLAEWKLNAELVTLSACQSGLGLGGGGEGFLGFAQALLLAGSRSVCLSLWKVDDTATALLMDRLYANVFGQRENLKAPMGKAEALAEAKRWLRSLTVDQAAQQTAELTSGVARGERGKNAPLLPTIAAADAGAPDAHPYAHPHYWAAFVLIGDPQ
jgi:CHAT domain-containing protein